jgi:hypothetical protein
MKKLMCGLMVMMLFAGGLSAKDKAVAVTENVDQKIQALESALKELKLKTDKANKNKKVSISKLPLIDLKVLEKHSGYFFNTTGSGSLSVYKGKLVYGKNIKTVTGKNSSDTDKKSLQKTVTLIQGDCENYFRAKDCDELKDVKIFIHAKTFERKSDSNYLTLIYPNGDDITYRNFMYGC